MDAIESGAGGDHDPAMEARVSRLEQNYVRIEALLGSIDRRLDGFDTKFDRLETRFGILDDRVRRLEIDIGEVKGRFMNIPSTWALITTIIGGQIALAGMVFTALRFAGAH